MRLSYSFSRIICGTWILFSLVSSAAYSGNLRAFLTNPDMTDPIATLEDLFESEYPWTFVMYGETLEHQMERTTDLMLRAFWQGKRIVDYKAFPYHVVRGYWDVLG